MLPIVLIAFAAVLFAQGMTRLRRRGRTDIAGWDRALLFGLGLALTLVALVGPLDRVAEDDYLSVHMLQHVLIGDAAPALFAVALRGPLLVFFLPAPALKRVARVRSLLSGLLRPRTAFGLWAANLAVWHVPWLYDQADRHDALHYFEHACWVVAGVVAWTLLVDPGSHRRLTVGGRVAFGAAMFAAGQVLTDVLVFAHPLYAPIYTGRLDQQLAGVVMMVEQLVTLGVMAFFLLRPRLREARLAAA